MVEKGGRHDAKKPVCYDRGWDTNSTVSGLSVCLVNFQFAAVRGISATYIDTTVPTLP